jgi:hypothetical protein
VTVPATVKDFRPDPFTKLDVEVAFSDGYLHWFSKADLTPAD